MENSKVLKCKECGIVVQYLYVNQNRKMMPVLVETNTRRITDDVPGNSTAIVADPNGHGKIVYGSFQDKIAPGCGYWDAHPLHNCRMAAPASEERATTYIR